MVGMPGHLGPQLQTGKIAEGQQGASQRPTDPGNSPAEQSSQAAPTSSPPPVPVAQRHRNHAGRAGGPAGGARRTLGTRCLSAASPPTSPPLLPCALPPLQREESLLWVHHFLPLRPKVFLPWRVTILQNRLVYHGTERKHDRALLLFLFLFLSFFLNREYNQIYCWSWRYHGGTWCSPVHNII